MKCETCEKENNSEILERISNFTCLLLIFVIHIGVGYLWLILQIHDHVFATMAFSIFLVSGIPLWFIVLTYLVVDWRKHEY